MATCCICKPRLILPCITALVQHLQLVHHTNASSKFTCGQGGCFTTYDNIHSFKRHLKKKHDCPVLPLVVTNDLNTSEPKRPRLDTDDTEESAPCSDSHDFATVDAAETLDFENDSCEDFTSNYQSQAETFIAKLYNKTKMPRNQVQEIIEDTSAFLHNGFLTSLKEKVLKSLNTSNAALNEVRDIQKMFEVLEDPFKNYKTEYLRLKKFINSGDFIPPIPYVMGKRLTKVTRDNTVKAQYTDVEGQFVPLRSVLQKFLTLPNALNDILSYVESLNPDQYSNIVQGPLWQMKIRNFKTEDIVLPLFIYFDEFEPNNPLGPHTDQLAAVYASIPCLPLECRATLENIFLVLLFESDQRIEFSNHKAFDPLVKELQFLETTGVTVNGKQIYFVPALITGDNKGVHEISGLISGFTANYPCRFCRLHKSVTSVSVEEDVSMLRDKDNYREDVIRNNESLTGVKEECTFHRIPSFHITSNAFVDMMHDLAEGWAHVVMVFILKYMIKHNKSFTMEVLNFRIDMFDFGPTEPNKPHLISDKYFNENGRLKMTAAEMLCFVKYFGILIGDLVPENDPYWSLYLSLQQVIELTLAKRLPRDAAALFKSRVKQLHEQYLILASTSNASINKKNANKKERLQPLLTPKAHHLTHYSTVFEQCGPIANLACWRFEAKHKPLKESAVSTKSRVNIAYTIAIKNQLQFCYKLKSNKGIIPQLEVGPGNLMQVDQCFDFEHTLPADLMRKDSQFFSTNWIRFKAIKYKPGMVLFTSIEECSPAFGKIQFILVQAESVIFVCKSLLITEFNEHVNAFHVHSTENWFSVAPKDLIDPMPLYCHTMVTGSKFIVMKYYI